MGRALKYDIPGADWRVVPDDLRGERWRTLFAPLPPGAPVVVEVGFGRGEFLVDLATSAPGVGHLGVEVSYKRVLKLARRLARSELGNVRLVQAPAEGVLRDVVPPASVAAFWINFPDPWPKKRHLRRRLLRPPVVRMLAERLVPGGDLHVATDHEDYAACIDAALMAEPLLANAFAPRAWLPEVPGRKPTAYELEWRAEGRALHFWHYRRSGGAGEEGGA